MTSLADAYSPASTTSRIIAAISGVRATLTFSTLAIGSFSFCPMVGKFTTKSKRRILPLETTWLPPPPTKAA
jgi:hypothetical protein